MKNFSVVIGEVTWKVRFVADSTIKRHADGEEVMGLMVAEAHTIYINKEMAPERRALTLLHELAHVFLLPALGTKDECDGKIEEELVCNLVAAAIFGMHQSGELTKCLNP